MGRRRGLLLAIYLLLAAGFLGTRLVTVLLQGQIVSAASDIADDSAPSIEHLSAARTEARRTETLLSRAIANLPPGETGWTFPRDLEDATTSLEQEIKSYLALPVLGGEPPYWGELKKSQDVFREQVSAVERDLEARRVEAARHTFDTALIPASNRLDQAISLDLEFNARNEAGLANRLAQIRTRAERIGLILDTAFGILTVLAGVLSFRAVEREHRAEERARMALARRAEELEAFAGRVAHDLNGPLHSLQLLLALAARKEGAPLERAQGMLERMQSLTRGLLEFARAGAKPEAAAAAPVRETLQSLLAELQDDAADQRVELGFHASSGLWVATSEGVLLSVVANLVRNAIKYMGEATVREVLVSVAGLRERVRITVQDTGPGLPPGLEERVFEPFVRGSTGKDGIGLGLATVKRLVEGHGGTVTARSRSGHGTTFVVDLPRAAGQEATERPEASPQP